MTELVQHVDPCDIQDFREDDIVIAFMGLTGVGKSHASQFIDLLTGQIGKRAGDSLVSVTHEIGGTRVKHKIYGDRIVLIDTPGFDDITQLDEDILEMIIQWFRKIYEDQKIVLSGFIYLHRITDKFMRLAPLKYLNVFCHLCGDLAMSRVTMVTTMWDDLGETSIGEEREEELKGDFWRPLIDKGCQVDRLYPADEGKAWGIIERLIATYQDRKPILLQEELVDLKMQFSQTSIGKVVYNSLKVNLHSNMKIIVSLLNELERLEKDLEKGLEVDPGDPERTRSLRESMKNVYKKFQQVHKHVSETFTKWQNGVTTPPRRPIAMPLPNKSAHAKAVELMSSNPPTDREVRRMFKKTQADVNKRTKDWGQGSEML